MRWRRATIGILAALPVIALFGFGMTRDPREIPSPLPGRLAPAFTLAVMATADGPARADVTGDSVSLAERRGEVVVLNFWASWCLACRSEHRALSEIAELYRDRGVAADG